MRGLVCVCYSRAESDFIYITLSRACLKFDLLCMWMHMRIPGSMRGKDKKLGYNKQIKGFRCSHLALRADFAFKQVRRGEDRKGKVRRTFGDRITEGG